MNYIEEQKLFPTREPPPIRDSDVEEILMKASQNRHYHYGILTATESRRRYTFRTIVCALEALIQSLGDVIDRVVSNAICFKNGSCIRVFSSNEYEYRWHGYRFDAMFFDEHIPRELNIRVKSQMRLRTSCFGEATDTIICQDILPKIEPQIDTKTWEDMIWKGITKERMQQYI